jgi:NADH-quinone oxidoreductase subunit N
MSTSTVYFLLPEIVLIAAAVLIYIVGAFLRTQKAWSWFALAGIIVSMFCLSLRHDTADSGVLLSDGFTFYIRWLTLALGLLLILLNFQPLINGGTPEAIGSLLLVIAGGMLVVSANDLILLFVALELISIPTYILLYLGPGNVGRQESAAKYFFLSVLSSVILLYGFSFIYGVAGTMNLDGIRIAFTNLQDLPKGFDNLAKLALLLTFSGLSFRLAAAPFHFYAPDVYQGTSNPNAALLSLIPKAAGLAVLVRLVGASMPGVGWFAWQITLAVAILTMTLGNTMALWQINLRRMMAYSSIAHAGYMLIGLAVALAAGNGPPSSWDGIAAMLFYLCVYAAATLGAFAMFEYLGHPTRRVEDIDELAGLSRTRPVSAAMIAVFMFSLTGIPPLAGFWGKLQIFGSALNVNAGVGGNVRIWFAILAIIGVLNAAISAGYYLRIVGIMYFSPPTATPRTEGGLGALAVAVACTLLIMTWSLYPGPLLGASNQAVPVISGIQKLAKGDSPIFAHANIVAVPQKIEKTFDLH